MKMKILLRRVSNFASSLTALINLVFSLRSDPGRAIHATNTLRALRQAAKSFVFKQPGISSYGSFRLSR